MKLKELMSQNKVTQNEMAKILNVSRSAIYKYQQDKAEPNIETLIKIADYFCVSLDFLLERQNKNLIFTDSLSPEKKELINMIRTLNDDETLIAIGMISKLANQPIDQIMSKIKNQPK